MAIVPVKNVVIVGGGTVGCQALRSPHLVRHELK